MPHVESHVCVRTWSCALARCAILGAEGSGVGVRCHWRTRNGEELGAVSQGPSISMLLSPGHLPGHRGETPPPPLARSMRPVTSFCLHHDADTLGVVPTHHSGGMVAMNVLARGTLQAAVASVWSRERFFLGLQGPKARTAFCV